MLRMPKFCGRGTPPCATAVKLKPVCDTRITGVERSPKGDRKVDGAASARDRDCPDVGAGHKRPRRGGHGQRSREEGVAVPSPG